MLPSLLYRTSYVFSEVEARSGYARLTMAPTRKVMQAPINTNQVKATLVYRKTRRTEANPAIIPLREPFEFERESKVPRRKSPKRLPNGREATVSPASSKGPHLTSPKNTSAAPHASVTRRDNFRSWAGSV